MKKLRYSLEIELVPTHDEVLHLIAANASNAGLVRQLVEKDGGRVLTNELVDTRHLACAHLGIELDRALVNQLGQLRLAERRTRPPA